MTGTPHTRSAQDAAADRTRRLLRELESAIDAGRVDPRDVERLLGTPPTPHRHPPSAASVLYALGAAIIFVGMAIALGTQFSNLPWLARVLTPLIFPAVAFAASIALHRRKLTWQSDAAGLVGYVAYGIAIGVSVAVTGWATTTTSIAGAIAIAAAAGAVISFALFAVTGSRTLGWVGVPLGTGVAVPCLAVALGVVGTTSLCWVILVEAIAAACIAWQLRSRPGSEGVYMAIWALLAGYAAVANAGIWENMDHLNPWHGILAVIVIIAFVAASETGLPSLLWLAAFGGVAWVFLIAVVVGSATGLAVAVVLAGAALVALGFIVARLRSRRIRHRPHAGSAPA